jgi:cysteinyl-tRNA synthetase
MAKSTHNLVLVGDLLEQASGAALRLMLLMRPWAEHWEFLPEMVPAAAEELERLYAAAGRPGGDSARGEGVRSRSRRPRAAPRPAPSSTS